MTHFAQIVDGRVTEVIVAEQDIIDSGVFGTGWVQTSYNTHGNKHAVGGSPLRGNYAGIGYTYDSVKDAFYAPQPYPSWTLSADFIWEAPIPRPEGRCDWDEATLNWIPNVL